ncbi:uncharacterized protein RHIMIDRAFT_261217 [Rhizopus microsporus ATCC 52813]|uniref:Uncharacterized protein n=1 Tax=Rhizopus microsporus ATCC 52813 TaxID=1340429 RepID=A0A2G4SMD7_RHIZD|nr:uncharacterized protein RHIMIDRAFT_261217 [Rhizopus microsporus ATCC 52813]PHZ09902.1 hypothetical protein RHIMIDRAFT_261217 [Rhizopus microsporus ATCC 52813]
MALYKFFLGLSFSLTQIEQSMLTIAVSHISTTPDTLSPIVSSISLLSLFGCTLYVFYDTHFTCQTMLASLEQMVFRLHHGNSYSFD